MTYLEQKPLLHLLLSLQYFQQSVPKTPVSPLRPLADQWPPASLLPTSLVPSLHQLIVPLLSSQSGLGQWMSEPGLLPTKKTFHSVFTVIILFSDRQALANSADPDLGLPCLPFHLHLLDKFLHFLHRKKLTFRFYHYEPKFLGRLHCAASVSDQYLYLANIADQDQTALTRGAV